MTPEQKAFIEGFGKILDSIDKDKIKIYEIVKKEKQDEASHNIQKTE